MYRIIVVAIALLFSFSSFSQLVLPEYTIAKAKNDKVYVKWEPTSVSEWESSKVTGYQVSIYSLFNGEKKLVSTKKIRPANNEEWELGIANAKKNKLPFFEGANQLLDMSGEELQQDEFFSSFDDIDNDIMEFKMGFLVYAGIYDMKIAELSGLATTFDIPAGRKLVARVELPGYNAREVAVMPNAYYDIDPPMLNGEWGDRIVDLDWKITPDLNEIYYGYILEHSDDGINFTSDELPHVKSMLELKENEVSTYRTIDSLEQNNKTYYYRIKGLDYFGDRSTNISGISGYGYDAIRLSPMITNAQQLDDNKAYLEWKIHGPDANRIDGFTILRTDTLDSIYEIIQDSLPGDVRSATLPMEYTTNYFRIEAYAKGGKPVSSSPVFIMGQDTVAPTTPILLSATIDSLGRTYINWQRNMEPDLWGYRVYRSYFEDDEYALITNIPTQDTFLLDSISIHSSTDDNVYYMIQAADKRNNRSDFSEPIVLEKPDVLAPSATGIKSITQIGNSDTLSICFYQSISRDVEHYEIYRKRKQGDTEWMPIGRVSASDSMYCYYDVVTLDDDEVYEYTVVVVDDAGLDSGPCKLKSFQLRKEKEVLKDPYEDLRIHIDEQNESVKFEWIPKDGLIVRSVLVYRGQSKSRLGKYKLIQGPEVPILEDKIKKDVITYYQFKTELYGHKQAFYSELITIEPIGSNR